MYLNIFLFNMDFTEYSLNGSYVFEKKEIYIVGLINIDKGKISGHILDPKAPYHNTEHLSPSYVLDGTVKYKGNHILLEFEKIPADWRMTTHKYTLRRHFKRNVMASLFPQQELETIAEKYNVNVEGVFIEIGLDPNSEFTEGVRKNDKNEIAINAATETNIPGIFAAGDVTDVIDKQIVVSAGEGAKAALSAFRYLSKLGE